MEKNEVFDLIKKRALKIGEHTRSCVLVEIDMMGAANITHFSEMVSDLAFMEVMMRKMTSDKINTDLKMEQ